MVVGPATIAKIAYFKTKVLSKLRAASLRLAFIELVLKLLWVHQIKTDKWDSKLLRHLIFIFSLLFTLLLRNSGLLANFKLFSVDLEVFQFLLISLDRTIVESVVSLRLFAWLLNQGQLCQQKLFLHMVHLFKCFWSQIRARHIPFSGLWEIIWSLLIFIQFVV